MHGLASALGLLANPDGSQDAHELAEDDEDEDMDMEDDEPGPAHIRVLRPALASEDDLLSFHDTELVERLLSGEESTEDDAGFGLEDVRCIGTGVLIVRLTYDAKDCAPFPSMREYVLAVAGASLAAARELVEGRADVSTCWDGGRYVSFYALNICSTFVYLYPYIFRSPSCALCYALAFECTNTRS